MTSKSHKTPAEGDRGQATRERIVERALLLAALKGLEGISIGRLAQDLHISKSGLFAHFGSKQNLQIAVVERASLLFFNYVLPTEEEGLKGIERLWVLCENRLTLMESGALPRGYFFTGAFFQCAGQQGAIPQLITDIVRRWIDMLRVAVDTARDKGELRSEVDARQTALELTGILLGAECSSLLGYGDRESARSAILSKLSALATEKIPADAFDSLKRWQDYLDSRHQ